MTPLLQAFTHMSTSYDEACITSPLCRPAENVRLPVRGPFYGRKLLGGHSSNL